MPTAEVQKPSASAISAPRVSHIALPYCEDHPSLWNSCRAMLKSARSRTNATNVTSAADWKDAVDKAMAQFGKIDILVNNAGWTYRRKESLEVTESEYD